LRGVCRPVARATPSEQCPKAARLEGFLLYERLAARGRLPVKPLERLSRAVRLPLSYTHRPFLGPVRVSHAYAPTFSFPTNSFVWDFRKMCSRPPNACPGLHASARLATSRPSHAEQPLRPTLAGNHWGFRAPAPSGALLSAIRALASR